MRTIKAIVGFILMIIGVGGIKDDLQQWLNWLHINDVNSDIWWGLLLAIGFLLLILNLIPHNTLLKTIIRKLPILKSILIKLPTDRITAFYNTRLSLNQKYGGIQEELTNSDKVWAACHGATYFATLPPEFRQKVEKLLLIDPNSPILSMYSCASQPKANIQDLKSDILKATELFQESRTKVKWFNGLFNLITILDPDTKKAQARVEVWLFEESGKRQNYVINRKTNKEAYKAILDTFNKMWDDTAWSREPPKDLNEVRRTLGLYTPNSPTQPT